MKRSLQTALFATSMLFASAAAAQSLPNQDLVCRTSEPTQDKYTYLRSLTLDLLGTVPTMEDYARLDGLDDVPEEMIDGMLNSEAFVERAVRRHRGLFWNNIRNIRMVNVNSSLRGNGTTQPYWRTNPARRYRGDTVGCANSPATFDANGNIQVTTDANGIRREGYVEVHPYWEPDPTATVRICAFDGQANLRSPSGTDCGTNAGFADTGCGCGPELRICVAGGYGDNRAVNDAIAEDLDRRIGDVIREGRPYTDIFNSRKAWVNGPLVHFLKYQANISRVRMNPLSYDLATLPDLKWTDYEWRQIDLSPEHAGVLTTPAFLLRFQTNRARANRFFEEFLCQPFTPPTGGLPAADPNVAAHPDLQQRDGCNYCHAILEPAAAHWGRWGERGASFLDTERFPTQREDCRQCGLSGRNCSTECRSYYVTRTFSPLEEPYIGSLQSVNFLHQDHRVHVDMGPRLLVSKSIVDDRFPTCAARRTLEGLFGRELSSEERDLAEQQGREFVGSNFKYQDLVKAVVTSKVYRRVR